MKHLNFRLILILCVCFVSIINPDEAFSQQNDYDIAIRLTEQRRFDEAKPYIKKAETEEKTGTVRYLNLLRCEIQCFSSLSAADLNNFLTTSKTVYGPADSNYWRDVLWAASYCYEAGDHVQAKKLMKIAEDGFAKSVNGPLSGMDTLSHIIYLDLKGRLAASIGRVDKAVTTFKKSSDLKCQYYGEKSFEYIESLTQIADTYTLYSKPQKAVEYHNKALSAMSEDVKLQFRVMTEAEREKYWNSVLPYFEGSLDAAFFVKTTNRAQRKVTKPAYDAILLSKSALLSAARMGEDYYYTTLDDIVECLEPGDVCIEYFRTRTGNYGALVMKRGWTSPKIIRLKRDFDIGSRNYILEEAIPYTPPVHEYDDYREFLYALRCVIWPNELLSLFPTKGNGKVYFSTAGKLDLCPIECLPLYEMKESLIVSQAYDICRLTSTREIVRNTNPKESPLSDVALFGGIDYYLDSLSFSEGQQQILQSQHSNTPNLRLRDSIFEQKLLTGDYVRRDKFNPLPGSLKEICYVDSLLDHNCHILTGKYASSEGLTVLSDKATTLLISTHGYSDNPSLDKVDITTYVDPLERCGILVAGIEGRSDSASNLLSARDVAALDLTNVSLSVLASCNSIGEEVEKDGVFGLMRAFKLAGVHSIIYTLWPIEDTASSLFLSALFDNIIDKHLDVSAAFSLARDEMREQYPETFYWSPFVLIDGQQ